FTLPMSASLTFAVTCRSSSVARVRKPPVALLELDEEVEDDEEEELPLLVLPAPPLICWPTTALIAVTVPSIGEVRVAAARLFSAILTATCALATCAACA